MKRLISLLTMVYASRSRIKYFLFPIFFLIIFSQIGSAHLVTMDAEGEYTAGLSFYPNEPPIVDENSTILIILFNTTDYEPFSDLDVVHERIMHVLIAGEDLDTFAHIHPEDFENGTANKEYGYYYVDYIFPKAGNYVVFLDYTIKGKNVQKLLPFRVVGVSPPLADIDFSREKNFGDYRVKLAVDDTIIAGKEVNLDYYIEKNGKPVNDLQLYLGAEMHAFVLKSDLTNASHTHPYVPGHFVHYGNMTQRYSGPTIPIKYTFTKPGDYVIFAQFKHNDSVITTKFAVKVKESESNIPAQDLSGIIIPVIIFGIVFIIFVIYSKKGHSKRKKRSGHK